MSGILQLKHHKAMWCNGRKFRIKQLDETRKTSDSGITAVFQVTNVSSRSDRRPRESENRYYGFLNDIIECDFNSFKLVLFDVKWYRLQMHEHDEERTIIQHANGFPMIKTTVFEKENDRYVFPSQCEQVFYSKVPGKRDWSFVVRYDPRGRPVKYIVDEEDDIEEEDDVELEQEEYGSTDEEDREDEPGVGDNAPVLDDDIDEDMLENDIDDDDDIINPFNIVSEPDVDTDVELDDQEEDTEEG
jgi:hypothetical protein